MSPSNDVEFVESSSTFSLSRVGNKKTSCVHRSNKRPLGLSSSESHQPLTFSTINNTHIGGSSKSSGQSQAKKRSRKDVLASISANARKKSAGTLPIPSFKTSTTNSTKLGQLERAFFDDESDDDGLTRTKYFDTGLLNSSPNPNGGMMQHHERGLIESDDEDDDLLFAGTSPFQQPKNQSQHVDTKQTTTSNDSMRHQYLSETILLAEKTNNGNKHNQESTLQLKEKGDVKRQSPSNGSTELLLLTNQVKEKIERCDEKKDKSDTNRDSQMNEPCLNNRHATCHSRNQSHVLQTTPCVAVEVICKGVEISTSYNQVIHDLSRGESKLHTVPDPRMDVLTEPGAKPKVNSGRSRKQKQSDPKVTHSEVAATTVKNGPEAPSIDAPTRVRRRARMQCCALCKTCPCQKVQNPEASTIVDLNAFSRSAIAMERALIRRIQKLEKSSESLEEQTEMVRRKLKAHQRDTWKRTKLGMPQATTIDEETGGSYFLPDAEVFERQQMESIALNPHIVQKVQQRLFENVPLQQVTLTQMMGFTREEHQQASCDIPHGEAFAADEGTALRSRKTDGENVVEEECKEEKTNEDDEQSEYVEETECTDVISRVHRNGAAEFHDEHNTASFSLWDSIVPMTQGVGANAINNSAGNDESTSKWDELFQLDDNDQDDKDDGLNDLLNLFDEDENGKADTKPCSANGRSSTVLLSQEAQAIADQIISDVGSKSEMLDRSCPNWKENISFALCQDDRETIEQALENVQEARRRMLKVRQKILEAWERQDAALEVFETALEASTQRLNAQSLPTIQSKEDD
ncbi:hypothetical protein IV203_007172 [Nitzschia inconspicua]|uniref:Uncharacterized protein n=1 Tax=Nitzschia inconspicua TaxID=303405 RepID=A0A9K3KEA9_9STRA|nr:hypothetical protein IV203_007172 [Nitzschia inconspicua]